jgi:hypothetical protein
VLASLLCTERTQYRIYCAGWPALYTTEAVQNILCWLACSVHDGRSTEYTVLASLLCTQQTIFT